MGISRTTKLRRRSLPSPYFPIAGGDEASALWAAGGADLTGAAYSTTNIAVYLPVFFPEAVTVTALIAGANNGTGNYDLGFYEHDGTLIQAKGSTAMTAAGTKTLTLTNPYRVSPNKLYYAAMSLSSATGQKIGFPTVAVQGIAAGFAQQATAHPLPSPAVFATFAQTHIPLIGFLLA